MTYPSQNFYPGIEPARRSGGSWSAGSIARAAARFAESLAEGTKSVIGDAISHYAYWRAVRQTARQLYRLDDATLRDIGLHRSQIPDAARRTALARRAAAVEY